ncbi:transmembrane 4 L6 family member 18 [Clarias gariepinus]|uniref:transmembrane 4 L6 family member 18 n=1 Tax=Clarias gariepinus TaxID=13013 RepID=UPI00234D1E82|nr:transmembrane 4 L6 family member 18 [Clarias gariepinus]
MCSLGFAKSLGFALIPLATCCIVANLLLFFPDGKLDYIKNLTVYVWYFMGIGGGGIAVLITAFIFLSLGKCADSCVTKSSAMCASVGASLIGLAGSCYCFIISAIAMLEGPTCMTDDSVWTTPFKNNNETYLFKRESWHECKQPPNIVEWNVILLSILLGISLIEFLICFVQFISGLVSALCRLCCYKQQYSLSA